ncbi:MAG: ABC transporter ATP-binding protein [Clostridia bacterium]|nr:ABC transporter ATP-binding protein [Clostridia bacterium]MBQ9735155.1 ABC transporter ATP-binding protein [Clostridia bacterium]
MDVKRGEILSVLGENGCGKTTLMNMLAGIYYPDEGKIIINGEEASIRSPKDAFRYNIGMIHQHFKLVDVFTAAENIVLGTGEGEKYDLKSAKTRILAMSEKYGFHIDLDKKVHEMSVSEKQTVEIIKVLYRGADVLILDEPTAVLTPQEITRLFDVLRAMREDGKSVLIITHKLNEVMEISDRVAVLRKGEHIATVNTADTTEKELADMMVGQKVTLNIDRPLPVDPELRLSVESLTLIGTEGKPVLDGISFGAYGGEILGIAGIAGSGQRELLESIAGLHHLESGTVTYFNPKKDKPITFYHKSYERVMELAHEGMLRYADGRDFTGKDEYGKSLSKKTVKALVNAGEIFFKEDEVINLREKTPLQIRELGVRFSFVPEDRLGMGLVGNMDITDNMMLRSYRRGKSVFVDRKAPEELANEIIASLQVVTPDTHTPVRRLSGGNVQKVLVGREIAAGPKVLMAAYPVRGLDINSSYTIYNLLTEQKKSGVAVVFVGEDLDVLLALCDRIMVIAGGKVMGTVDARTAKKEEIGLMMTGAAPAES